MMLTLLQISGRREIRCKGCGGRHGDRKFREQVSTSKREQAGRRIRRPEHGSGPMLRGFAPPRSASSRGSNSIDRAGCSQALMFVIVPSDGLAAASTRREHRDTSVLHLNSAGRPQLAFTHPSIWRR
jgi:hypothetical protein